MPRICDITGALEERAPLSLQESYDNSGLQLGDANAECTGALVCVDVTPAIVDEAVTRGCNLIISHHPLIFKGLKRLTGQTLPERTVIAALKAGVAVYSCHTCMDNATQGVSWEMARRLGLDKISVLDPQPDKMWKLTTFVPHAEVETVRNALFSAGAGHLGNYDSCSYSLRGEGTFRALAGANPFVGEHGKLHIEPETRLEALVPDWCKNAVEKSLLATHPYEEPAYEFMLTGNLSKLTGSGVIGELPTEMSAEMFAKKVKETFGSPVTRCSSPTGRNVRRIALCGGSGSFLASAAIAAGADAFLTSDTKYHDFVELADSIFIVDIGHFESEEVTKSIFYHVVKEKFPTFAVQYSQTEKNHIYYL